MLCLLFSEDRIPVAESKLACKDLLDKRKQAVLSKSLMANDQLDNYLSIDTHGPTSTIVQQMNNGQQSQIIGVELPPHTQNSLHDDKEQLSWYWRYMTGTPAVIVGALLGIGIGVSLSKLKVSMEVAEWIALPGDLFIRALKLLVVPMVFASLAVGMADILSVGKASIIGWRASLFYVFTSIVASIQSVMWALLFRGFFKSQIPEEVDTTSLIGLKCSNGLYMTTGDDGNVTCSATSLSNKSNFFFEDVNNVFVKNDITFKKLSLSDQLFGLFKQMVSDNITQSFSQGALLSVVMFAIPFGVAVAKSHAGSRSSANHLLEFLRQVNNTFLLLIRWIINLTPFSVISLIAGSIAKNLDNLDLLNNVAFFLGTLVAGVVGHLLLVMPAVFFFFTKTNPYFYLKQMIPAQVFAFGCASSMATLPVTMRCVDATKQVSRSLSRFVVSIGATINMDGSALYFPAGIIFMAETSGLGDKLGTIQLFLLVIVSTIASVGGAPVPNAGLVMIITVWHTVMNKDLPPSFSFLVAIDWLADRFRTLTNITGDTMITRIVADQVDETYLDEQDRNQNL